MATRWGICSTGLIANDFVTALKSLPTDEHQVVAVAAQSDKSKAESFAKKYDIPAAYGTYEELAKDPNVEIVYIGTVHPFHHKACLMYLDHGKHVLCEKPLTMTLEEAQEVTAKAKEKKLFLMEGLWTRFFPAYRAMVEEVSSGSLGDVRCVQATAVTSTGQVKPVAGGALMALACYPITFVQQVFKERPEKIVALGQFSEEGGDLGGSISLQYKGGQIGLVYFNRAAAMGNSTVTIHGTKANLQVPDDMHTPTRVTFPVTSKRGKREETFPLPDTQESFNYWNSIGFVYEAQAVRSCLQKGLTECPEMTHEDSLTAMYILDEVSKQLGIHSSGNKKLYL
ncbi:trans-1,2-dihydrobenzene-1,2-diol dehydrogenase-like [Littorina saxatilis]|uniref:Trans-1,2-dihydrobenzene-1,2-diol dehydrogenase n=1 Tax=Littorina saxatilis TaxID=31220 RepID=A0AAN9AN57_9CAEN